MRRRRPDAVSGSERVDKGGDGSSGSRPGEGKSALGMGKGVAYDLWNADQEQRDSGGAAQFFMGIDLGTTNSCVALWHLDKNRVKIVRVGLRDDEMERLAEEESKTKKNKGGKAAQQVVGSDGKEVRTMPSAVFFEEGQTRPWVGHAAVRRAKEVGKAVVISSKRLIGLQASDPVLDEMIGDLPVRVGGHTGTGEAVIELPKGSGRDFVTPVEVATLVIAELKQRAEAWLDEGKVSGLHSPVEGCVIGVPVHFGEARRRATRAAGVAAGFKRVVVLGESSAAAMAYGLFVAGSKVVVTFDFGGGTLDVSVLRLNDGTVEVLSTAGDNHLGGDDMDSLLLQHCLREWGADGDADDEEGMLLEEGELQELRGACARLKETLSVQESASLQFLVGGRKRQLHLTRGAFEDLISGLVARAKAVVQEALRNCSRSGSRSSSGSSRGGKSSGTKGLLPSQVQEVVLVGGCSRIPSVRAMLMAEFGRRVGDDEKERKGGIQELCCAVNPDEAVAEGAAIRGAILSGVARGVLADMLMLDVLPMDIGILSADGSIHKILRRNSPLPVSGTVEFLLADREQKGVSVDVLEDGLPMQVFSFLLSRVRLEDVPLEEQQQQRKVSVTLTMTEEGVFRVKVVDNWEAYAKRYEHRQAVILVCYLALLCVIYVACRVGFATMKPEYDDLLRKVEESYSISDESEFD